jgi:hypothetical protein
MKNRFNLNESEKNHIRGLHGINLINENTASVDDKSGMVTCVEQNYDIPSIVINMAGSIADNMLRSDALKGKDESEMYGVWMGAFMNNLLMDKRTDPKLVEDIKNSTGCMFDILNRNDMLDIVMNEQVVGYGEQGLDEDAGMDTPGGNPEYFYGDGSLDKLRKFAEEQDSEMSKEEIVKNLLQIQGLLSEGAPAIALRRVTELLGKMGEHHTIEESKQSINEEPMDNIKEWMYNSNKRIEETTEDILKILTK